MLQISPAADGELDDVRTLFREYSSLVSEALCFQGFEQELTTLPGDYAAPGGVLLLARDDGDAAGCVALRRLDAESGEMKRMYVRDNYRGGGLGRRLVYAVIAEARTRSYRRLLLDTLPKLTTAIALYRSLGFREIPPYLEAPTPGAVCFELRLS
jgi:GNAT superfamily N-acetyltransferase